MNRTRHSFNLSNWNQWSWIKIDPPFHSRPPVIFLKSLQLRTQQKWNQMEKMVVCHGGWKKIKITSNIIRLVKYFSTMESILSPCSSFYKPCVVTRSTVSADPLLGTPACLAPSCHMCEVDMSSFISCWDLQMWGGDPNISEGIKVRYFN